MRRQPVSIISLALAVMLCMAAPAKAGTITFDDVVRTVGANGQLHPASEVRLRSGVQSGTMTSQNTTTQGAAPATSQQPGTVAQQTAQNGPSTNTTTASPDSTLSQSGGHVETVDLGDVTGTVCDCGEIPRAIIPKGGFPWWTLAGIPIVCVSGICTRDDNPPPTCTETGNCTPPPQVPEPMTLLLFGTGLLVIGAGARRRHGRKQLETSTLAATSAEEV